jgi:hypothetical protein
MPYSRNRKTLDIAHAWMVLMTKTRGNSLVLVTALWLLFAPPALLADRPADFEARLEVSRNGKVMGGTTFTFDSDDDRWTMHSETKGRYAKVVPVSESSRGEGDWQGDRPRPIRYEREVSAVLSRHWAADFDWAAGVVRSEHPDGESTLELSPGVVDETALGLIIRAGLGRGEKEWFLDLLDEDEIDRVHFRVSEVKLVQTPLGCMEVAVVEKVRGEESKRYTRTYYAVEHDFVPVMIEHGKRGEDHNEGRVIALSVEGKAVQAGPACSP